MLFVTETVSNFLCSSKAQFILVFVMVVLGRYMVRRNVKEFIPAGVGIVCLYDLVGPLVSWGRDEIVRETRDSGWSREFSWDHVGRMMLQTYLWLIGGGTPPEWVHTD